MLSPPSPRLALVALVLTGACSPQQALPDSAVTAAPAPATPSAGAPAPQPSLAAVSREQFAQLRWLEGTWRGTGVDQAPFFERYRVVNDTTIHMESFTDSTLTTTSGESDIVLTGGQVLNRGEGGRASGAVMVNATSIEFVPAPNGFSFAWRRGATPDEWTAEIGARRDRVYTLRRWAPPR